MRQTTHAHFHCCIIDGVLAADEDGQLRLAETITLTGTEVAAVQLPVQSARASLVRPRRLP